MSYDFSTLVLERRCSHEQKVLLHIYIKRAFQWLGGDTVEIIGGVNSPTNR